MGSKKSKLLVLVMFLIVVISSITFMATYSLSFDDEIKQILKTDSYSYLPKKAQNYIKEIYKETNEVVLTEKNKRKNTPYLNPKYVEYLELSKKEKDSVALIPSVFITDYDSEIVDVVNDTFPTYYNLGNVSGKNYLSPMYNQGSYGLCWAFASIEQAESYLMVKSNTSYNSSSERFSVRQMDYATSIDGIDRYNNEVAHRSLTGGGNYFTSSLMMSYGMTLTDDNDWPYNTNSTKKEALADVLNFENSKYELESSITMPVLASNSTASDRSSFNTTVKDNVMKYGGAYVGTYSPDGKCGFKNTDGTYTILQNATCGDNDGHAMHIVGWDDNYSYSYCNTSSGYAAVNASGKCATGTLTNGKGAWIIKNSWGNIAAFDYVYLAYDSYGFEVSFTTSLVSMDDREWDNNYYKNIVSNGYLYFVSTNDVTYNKGVNTPEKVEKVKFMTRTTNGSFTVSISTPTKTYSNIKTITTTQPGIYTIDLSDKNIVLDGASFSVTVKANSTVDKFFKNSIAVFTSNVNSDIGISTSLVTEDDLYFNSNGDYELVVYSNTKNIKTNSLLSYSLYKDGVDYSHYIKSVKNNDVAVNNANAILVLDDEFTFGEYDLITSYGGVTTNSKVSIALVEYEGSGTQEDPFLIYNETELRGMKRFLNAYYLLTNDIVLTDDWIPIGDESNPFIGGFDGGGHTISNLKYSSLDESGLVGFFGYVEPLRTSGNAKTYFRNIRFDNIDMSGQHLGTGTLIGYLAYDFKSSNDSVSYSSKVDISNIYLNGGKIKSATLAGSLIGIVDVGYYSNDVPYLNIDKVYSNMLVDGYEASGLIGAIWDGYQTDSSLMLQINIKNLQNVGKNVVYSNTTIGGYSPGIGILYGNTGLNVQNYIINTLIGDTTQMQNYVKNANKYLIGYYASSLSPELSYNVSNGYYITKYYNKNSKFTSSLNVKDSSLYTGWSKFDDYWGLSSEDEISRIPILKGVDYSYTNVTDITLDKGKSVSLLDYIQNNGDYNYVFYEIVNNDGIISIVDNSIDDITISALKAGNAIIKVINHYDGFEKNINIDVISNDVPTITYYKDADKTEKYVQSVISRPVNIRENNFIMDGHSFVEWNTKADGSGIAYAENQSIDIVGNLELYAQWEPEKYIVTFDSNGGIGTMDSQEFVYGVRQAIKNNEFTKDRHVFIGWNTKIDGTGTSYNNMQEINVTKNITLYAQWEPEKYIVTFDSNGGTGTMDSQEFVYGVSQKIKANSFTKSGYIFKEWNTMADGTGTSYSNTQVITIEDNLTLYAQWLHLPYSIDKYIVDEVNKYIDMIDVNTSKEDFISNIKFLTDIYSVSVDTVSISGKDILYTGGKTRIYRDGVLVVEYTNIIRGDITGDGIIDYLDYVYVYNHIYKSKHPESDKLLLDGASLVAADASNDDIVDYLDYVKIYNKIKELKGGSN